MMIATKCEQILYGIRATKRNGPYVVNIGPLPAPAASALWGCALAFSSVAQHHLVPNGSGDG
jgi:hypothetical protein